MKKFALVVFTFVVSWAFFLWLISDDEEDGDYG